MLGSVYDTGLYRGAVSGFGALGLGAVSKLLVVSPIVVLDQVVVDDPLPLYSLLIVLGLSIAVEILVSLKEGLFTSRVPFAALGRVVAYITVLVAAHQATYASDLLRVLPKVFYAYVAITEFMRLIENMNALGVSLPLVPTIYRVFAGRSLNDQVASSKIDRLMVGLVDEFQKRTSKDKRVSGNTLTISKDKAKPMLTQNLEGYGKAELKEFIAQLEAEYARRKKPTAPVDKPESARTRFLRIFADDASKGENDGNPNP